MSARNFQMRMRCRYQGSDNSVVALEVEHRVADGWEPLDLGLGSPGFEIFVYAMLTCQHMYFRVNCAERGLVLDTAEGGIEVGAAADWRMESLAVNFSGRLAAGSPAAGDIDYITGRMRQCPVSCNLRAPADATTRVALV